MPNHELVSFEYNKGIAYKLEKIRVSFTRYVTFYTTRKPLAFIFLIGPIELSKLQLKGIIQGFEKFCGFFINRLETLSLHTIDTKTLT